MHVLIQDNSLADGLGRVKRLVSLAGIRVLRVLLTTVVLPFFAPSSPGQCTACSPPPPPIPDSVISAAALAANDGVMPSDVDFTLNDNPEPDAYADFWEGPGAIDDTIRIYYVPLIDDYGPPTTPYFKGVLTALLRHELGHKCASDRGGLASGDMNKNSCHHIAARAQAAAFACDKAHELADQLVMLLLQSPPPLEEIAALEQEKAGLCDRFKAEVAETNTRKGTEAAKDCLCGTPPYSPPSQCPDLEIPPPPGGCPNNYPPFPDYTIIPPCPDCPW